MAFAAAAAQADDAGDDDDDADDYDCAVAAPAAGHQVTLARLPVRAALQTHNLVLPLHPARGQTGTAAHATGDRRLVPTSLYPARRDSSSRNWG